MEKMSLMTSRPYEYSRMENEDPEEVKHRKAQFLIYKALEKADSMKTKSWLRVRICKLKIKIGKRLKKLRKGILCSISSTRIGVYRQIICQLKTWKRLFHGSDAMATTLPPIFA